MLGPHETHIRALIEEHGIWRRDVHAPNESAANFTAGWIKIVPDTDASPLGYYAALHEIGHYRAKHWRDNFIEARLGYSRDVLNQEGEATLYALSQYTPDPDTAKTALRFLMTYWRDRRSSVKRASGPFLEARRKLEALSRPPRTPYRADRRWLREPSPQLALAV